MRIAKMSVHPLPVNFTQKCFSQSRPLNFAKSRKQKNARNKISRENFRSKMQRRRWR